MKYLGLPQSCVDGIKANLAVHTSPASFSRSHPRFLSFPGKTLISFSFHKLTKETKIYITKRNNVRRKFYRFNYLSNSYQLYIILDFN